MLGTSPVIAFVATIRPESARAFYEETLGLRLIADEPFALVFDAAGTMLRIAKVTAFEPLPFTVLGWDVPDIGAAVRAMRARGVVFRRYDFLEQDDDDIWSAPGGARVAWFQDPDGNTLSLSEGTSL